MSDHESEFSNESVVLLHGLGRTRFSLFRLQRHLIKEFEVVNLSYPSRKYSIEDLAQIAVGKALEECQTASRIHFVTHSLGGILLRQYLSERKIDKLGNCVMLGPPNQGSELVDFFKNSPVLDAAFKLINGPAGQQLGTSDTSTPNSLGPVEFNLGVIAGYRSNNPLFSKIMASPSDGKVSVNSTKVTGMYQHLTLDVDHTFMMNNTKVIQETEHFLKYGIFQEEN